MSREVVKAMLEGAVEGNQLAALLNMDIRYFSKNKNSSSINEDIKILSFTGKVLVKVPSEARKFILDDSYTPFVLTRDDNEHEYEYVLKITDRTRIGFYK